MSESEPSIFEKIGSFLLDNYQLSILILFAILALLIPYPGQLVFDQAPATPNVLIALIFLGQGFGLNMSSINKAFENQVYVLLTVLWMLIIMNQINWLVVMLPLPALTKYALAAFLSMPTTMNSGLVFIGNVKGNVAFGLACVILGQLLSCFTIPQFLKTQFHQIKQDGDLVIELDQIKLLLKLVQYILCPTLAGFGLNLLLSYNNFEVPKYVSKGISYSQQTFLAMILQIAISKFTNAIDIITIQQIDVMLCLVIQTAQHCGFQVLFFNSLDVDYSIRVSVCISGCGKTFGVCAAVIMMLPDSIDKSVVTILCLVMFLSQSTCDPLLASYYYKLEQDQPIKVADNLDDFKIGKNDKKIEVI